MNKKSFFLFSVWYLPLANTIFAQGTTRQGDKDDASLIAYFEKKNLKPVKCNNGMYYLVTQTGNGENARAGQEITVNYTGKTINGKVFDSNTDEQFGHVQPLTFVLGTGQVIRGWDEGLTNFNSGAKGVLFIPSTLAYGNRSLGTGLAPNSILIFDIEVLDIDNE